MRMTGFCYVKRLMADSGIRMSPQLMNRQRILEREEGLGMMSYDEQTGLYQYTGGLVLSLEGRDRQIRQLKEGAGSTTSPILSHVAQISQKRQKRPSRTSAADIC